MQKSLKAPDEPKSGHVSVKVSPRLKEVLETVAKADGRTVSVYVERLIRADKAVKEALSDQ